MRSFRRTRGLKLWGGAFLLVAVAVLPAIGRAQVEVEADPTAYALNGYSVHVGVPFQRRNRVQAGVYGYDLPSFYGVASGFRERGNGATFKYDRFLRHRTAGFFAGADGNYTRTRYTLKATDHSTDRGDVTIGPRIGYRWDIGPHLYVTPWFSCGYILNLGDAVVIDGKKADRNSFGYFPTLHIGWRFGSASR
ncbi:MAG TPA: hypothetical protein VF018_12865 [Acidobacteriaceae bacterium]